MAVKPNVELELSRLKDFQRDTVEYVFDRMYKGGARRFLVADEVGLGKTMVARGVIAKAIDALWDTVERIDIIYICSNGSIARQNIARLNVSGARDAALPSRITLLPTVVSGLQERRLNFISLTPQTSFDLRSNLGTYEERVLLYHLLPPKWTDGVSGTAIQNLFQGGAERDSFRRRIKEFNPKLIDDALRGGFHEQIETDSVLQAEFAQACGAFQVWRQNLPDTERALQRQIVGRLRLDLATSCLKALEPDLIILDEFQRFKHLLDGKDQASELAQKLFNFGEARVLLLSATPYKMYTIADEAENDDHFKDFVQTVSFLQADEAKTKSFRANLDAYRDGLFATGSPAASGLDVSRAAVERDLRSVMVRTERLAASADRNGMLTEVTPPMVLARDDVSTYLAYARIAAQLEHGDIAEYWKSAPYLFNFMDDYQLKAAFKNATVLPKRLGPLRDALSSCPSSLLNWDDVERYRALDPANARLRYLTSDAISTGAWRWLWQPPSMPYYRLSGAFVDVDASRTTKRLIFSSWQVVPKVVSAVLSYEAERHMFGDRPTIERPNAAEHREKFRPLLRFAESSGRLTGMPIVALMYPSIALAEIGDPLELLRTARADGLPAASDVLNEIADRLRPLLRSLSAGDSTGGSIDQAWYWAAPALLDMAMYPGQARAWFEQPNISGLWREPDGTAVEEDQTGTDNWAEHVANFSRAAAGQVPLGLQPPDLPEVMAKMALAGPAVITLRALSRIRGNCPALEDRAIRNNAGWIAWGFRTLFNLPDVTAMLRREGPEPEDLEAGEPRNPYWRNVLDYCVDGGLQSVMDEFVHVAQEAEGVAHRPFREAARTVARRIANALQLRTATIGVDAISLDGGRVQIIDKRMRARFAARFGVQQTEEGASAARADDVRAAFNSPFWPFVLCSTSVGQEGLDFHLYCHAVVHWNLPSNPVDLEQREGRVHRFKGHAIRKNAAQLYGRDALLSDAADPWEAAFELARASRSGEDSDLVPFWILTAEGGSTIERHVPALPLSRDIDRANALRKTLTVYRMAFGQNRQDDIVAYLLNRFPADEMPRLMQQLRIDLAPQVKMRAAGAAVTWNREIGFEPVAEESSSWSAIGISLQRAAALLNDFAAKRAAQKRKGVDDYRVLLDRFAALRD